jgi:hypothetical protein
MSTRTNWDTTFDAINLCIDSKDFKEAKILIDRAIREANRVLVDPTFLVKQLKNQKKMVEDKLGSVF